MKRTAQLLAALAFAVTGCSADSSVPTDNHLAAHEGGLMLSSLSQVNDGRPLAALRRLIAPLHDVDNATAAGYNLLIAPPATAPDGCISDKTQGGMGYHYTRGNNLGDDSVSLLDPEFIVYAPERTFFRKDREVKRRLAALEYFLPFSAKWPAPTDPTFKKAPSLHDFSTTSDLPNVAFAATTRFGGWMFHIWLFEHNPGGLFDNWNRAVPLCKGSTF